MEADLRRIRLVAERFDSLKGLTTAAVSAVMASVFGLMLALGTIRPWANSKTALVVAMVVAAGLAAVCERLTRRRYASLGRLKTSEVPRTGIWIPHPISRNPASGSRPPVTTRPSKV